MLMLPVVIQFAARVSKTFLDSVNVRLHNADLMEELRRQKEAAEEANVAKSRFLAVASHDLRQPLHALGLFVQALQESSIAAQERHIVGNIRRSVDAMEELFDALLDISRLDAGVVRPRFETFALAAVFDRLNFEYGPVAKQKGLSLRVMKTAAYVCTDPTLFERIVRNLISNAVRYTDRGGLVLGCRRQDGGLRVEVWDTGRGIPAEKHREVFREFAQLGPSMPDPRKGLGLGLAIVERLARLLDHEIRLRSVPGKGSMFSVSVPRGREQDVMANTSVESTTPFDLTGVLILVIDSDPAALQAMETLLGKWNCEVIAAASGEEMKDKLAGASRVPSLIIADVRPRGPATLGAGPMPAVIDMLRGEFNSEIPAVLLTGDTGTERSARTQELAGLPVLHKPLNPARLRTLIANLLRMDEAEARSRRAS
jgi:CheY-like chemotaxis protein